MNPRSTNFHLLIAICLNEIVAINGGPKREAKLRLPSINLDSGNQTQKPPVSEIQEKPYILITPKAWMMDAYLTLQNYNIDFEAYKVLNIVEIEYSSVLIECRSMPEALALGKVISQPGRLDVKRIKFRGHVASINDLPEEIEQDEIMRKMAVKYHHSPRQIYFVPYTPGWKGDFKIALIDVNGALLKKMRASPKIRIRSIECVLNILLQSDRSVEDAEIKAVYNDPQLHQEKLDETKPPPKITQISKLSVTEAKSTTIESVTETCGSNNDRRPLIPRPDNTNKQSSANTVQKETIHERVRANVKQTLARILPLTRQSLFKMVDKSLDKALKAVLPLLKLYTI